MVRFSEHPAGGFHLTVTPGGCSGYSSTFLVAAAPAPIGLGAGPYKEL